MQMKKNHSAQGCLEPPEVGSGAVTVVVTGAMMPGGHVVHTGSGVVVVDVDEVVEVGAAVQTVTRVQSTDTCPVVDPRKVTTLVLGQSKPMAHVVGVGQSVVSVTAGVAKTMVLCGGHDTVVGAMVAGKDTVVTVGPVTVMVEVRPE